MKRTKRMVKRLFWGILPLLVLALASPAPGLAQSGTWTTKAPMPSVSAGPRGAVVAGTFYVVRPYVPHIGQDQAFYAYNPQTDQWTLKTNNPQCRHAFAIGVVDGIIYTAGGWDGGSMYDTVEAYNPITDSWQTKAPMPTARRDLAGAVAGGIFYAIGGNIAYASPYIRSEIEAYNPSTDTWTTGLAPMPTARNGLGAGVINGKIYAVGGDNGSDQYYAKLEVYDPAPNNWTTKASMPTARACPAVEVLNGKLYVIGGYNLVDGNATALNTVEVYDPETDSWTTLTPMPTARSNDASGAVNGVIYVAGGYDFLGNIFDTLEAFTPPITEITVSIDIKPGSYVNSINPKSQGKIPVAILSTPDFYAPDEADLSSLTFGRTGDEASLAFCTIEDVNGDGVADVVGHFYTQATGFQKGDTQGILKGKTTEGISFSGSDAVRIVPGK